MRHNTPFIVPATVPDAQVTRIAPSDPEGPIVISIAPAPVPVPLPVKVIPEQLTPEQVAVLRAENAMLREELDRVRSS